jgi:hypothetical protein
VLATRPQLGLEGADPGPAEQLRVASLGGELGGPQPGELLVHVRVGEHAQGTRGPAGIFPPCSDQDSSSPARAERTHARSSRVSGRHVSQAEPTA